METIIVKKIKLNKKTDLSIEFDSETGEGTWSAWGSNGKALDKESYSEFQLQRAIARFLKKDVNKILVGGKDGDKYPDNGSDAGWFLIRE